MLYINKFWYIPIALLVFGLLIFIHEFGHFFTARRFGVPIKEFSLGMGPKLFSFKSKKYETVYSLRIFPIGGYVSMVGEDEDSEDANALCKKPVWQRLIITAAGAAMNILFAILVMTVIVLFQSKFGSTTVHSFMENSTSSAGGLEAGDRIVKVNGSGVHVLNELAYEIMMQGTEPVTLEVERDGERVVLEDVSFPIQEAEGITVGTIDFYVMSDAKTPISVLREAVFRSWSTVKMIWGSLAGLITGRFGIEAVSGPVGVTGAIGEAASYGVMTLANLTVMISMNLGIFNLLPFPALDGGRIFFMLIELVRGKPIDPKYEGYVHTAGLFILFGFMIFITLKDIIKLLG